MLHSTGSVITLNDFSFGLKALLRTAFGALIVIASIFVADGRCVGEPATFPLVTVIVAQRLDWPTFSQSILPNVLWLRQNAAVGLLSPGLPRTPDPVANNWASFTGGDVINLRDPHLGLLQRQLWANGEADNVDIENVSGATSAGRSEMKVVDERISAWRQASVAGSTLIFCSISPDFGKDRPWDELEPCAIYSPPNTPPEASVTSATTRTCGLIALRDLAPTILGLVGSPTPPSMTGAPIQTVVLGDRDRALRRMDTITRLGQLAIVPLSWFLGVAALFAIAGGAWVAEGGRQQYALSARYLLRLVLAAPLALLLGPCLPVTTLPAYLSVLIGINLLLALIPSVVLILCATALAILGDVVLGSSLLASSVISGYWLSGIRFYGIGNEYMGVLIAAALLIPSLVSAGRKTRKGHLLLTAVMGISYLLVIVILSYPGYGAKAGGAVTSFAALAPAWFAIAFGRRPTWLTLAVAVAAGFATIFFLTYVAEKLHAPVSHIQAAVTAVHQGHLGYIKHIAFRKAKMAVKTVLTPGGIFAIVGLITLLIFWNQSRLRGRVAVFLTTRVGLARALSAGCYALVAALLFNDSGSVAFLFLFGAMALVLLHEFMGSVCDFSP